MQGITQPFIFTGGSGNISATGNIIRNMVSNANAAGTITMRGIVLFGSVGVNTVSQNTIHSLSNIVTGGGLTAIYAMDLSFPNTANVVERNFIHSCSITTTATTSQVRGILVRGTVAPAAASRATYKNNMIRLGLDATGASITTPYEISGIVENANTAGQNSDYYFNSIYIGGSGVGSPGTSTFGFSSSATTGTRNYKDNIFWNARSNAVAGGTAHFAIQLAGTAPNPAGTTSDFNDLFASGTDGNVGRFNAVAQLTLADWRTATGLDANSISVDPLFLNPTGTAATVNLHVSPTTPVNAKATPIAGITNDFDNETRDHCRRISARTKSWRQRPRRPRHQQPNTNADSNANSNTNNTNTYPNGNSYDGDPCNDTYSDASNTTPSPTAHRRSAPRFATWTASPVMMPTAGRHPRTRS